MTEENRLRVWRGLMRYWSKIRDTVSLSKDELKAAVDATDTWIDNNQASYNSALPSAAQSGLNATQKTVLFCAVAVMRVSPAFGRLLLGEVD